MELKNKTLIAVILVLILASGLIGFRFQKESKEMLKPTELSQIKVASQYRWVTDRISQSRGLDEVIKIFKETKTDFIFQGWLTQWPCPENCSDLSSETLTTMRRKWL